ncbi:hypothetical protein TNCT_677841 [Trichonephila clavata]|uniref:Uncharacterized protein n=1 Tax=Trichonephila clavata TaxID=2740835 RepID=A0A8X6IP29_TRICU|nr:hypothetical protein TNCT_677841 [Trichonephila clavata]
MQFLPLEKQFQTDTIEFEIEKRRIFVLNSDIRNRAVQALIKCQICQPPTTTKGFKSVVTCRSEDGDPMNHIAARVPIHTASNTLGGSQRNDSQLD